MVGMPFPGSWAGGASGRTSLGEPPSGGDSEQALRRMIDHCERQKARDAAYWERMIGEFRHRLAGLTT